MKLEPYRRKRDPSRTNEPFGPDREDSGATRSGAFVVHQHDARRMHWDLRLQIGGQLASFAVPKGPSLDPDERRLAVHTEDHPIEYLDFEAVIPEKQYGAGPMIAWDRGRVEYLETTAEEQVASGKLDFVLFGQKLRGRFALIDLKKSDKGWLLMKKKDAHADKTGEITTLRPRSVYSCLTVEELGRIGEVGLALERAAKLSGAPSGRFDARVTAPPEIVTHPEAPSGRWRHEVLLEGAQVLASRVDSDVVISHATSMDARAFYPEVVRALLALPISRVVVEGTVAVFDDENRPSTSRLQERLDRLASGEDPVAVIASRPAVLVVSDLLALGTYDLRTRPFAERRRMLLELLPGEGFLRPSIDVEGDATTLLAFCRDHALAGVASRASDSPWPSPVVHTIVGKPVGEVRHGGVSTPPKSSHPRPVIKNRSKIFWPEEGLTKGDLCDYYESIAPTMLPYLASRPVVLVRYPDGIQGKSFYQWNVPKGVPSWMQTLELPTDEAGDEPKRVFIVDDLESLLVIANLGCIPIHILASRAESLGTCDFFTIDFDLKGAELAGAVTLAKTLQSLLDRIGLVGFPKTSGQSGLHVLVPAKTNFEAAKLLCELVGRWVVSQHPELATMERVVKKRAGKIYVDTGQTGASRTIVAPYSARAHPGATVSTPLTWDEVVPSLEPKAFTMATVRQRVDAIGDPMHALLELDPDVGRATMRLETLLRA